MSRASIAVTLLLLSCNKSAPVEAPAADAAPPAPVDGNPELAAQVRAAIDASADPCVDFYQYACGGWIATEKPPADEVYWARSFSVIQARNEEMLKTLLEDAAKSTDGDADWRRMGDYYGSCVDEAAVEAAGLEPLKPMLDEIATVKDGKSLMTVIAHLGMVNGSPLFNGWIDGDFKDPGTNILYLMQGGLGLPDREYYLDPSEEGAALRKEYEATVAKMLGMIGEKDPEKAAAKIVAFETELAKISLPAEKLRDSEAIYHKIDRAGVQKLTPNLPWDVFFEASGRPDATALSVHDEGYFKGVDALVKKEGAKNLQPYLRWQLVQATASTLNDAMVQANFEFFGKKLSGQQEISPRWKRCVNGTTGAFPEIVGKYYVERAFPGDSKQIALEMIGDIEASFEANLPELEWMDDPTRAVAVEKMKAIQNKIGYPDQWRDYSAVTVTRGKHFDNVMAARRFETNRQLAKIGQPVDRAEWLMGPSMVNAYYNPITNEIAFPAGILQPPFFSASYPKAINYGAIGMVMGHEVTHGFDDEGRKFDATGKMTEWWSPEVAERFEERAQCVSDLYSTYEPQPGLKLNGELTLGENIADLGGIKQSYRAYKAWEKEHGAEPQAVAGVTNDQLLFIGYAQSWCSIMTPEMEKMLVTVDPHSPPKFRVNGPLSQLPEFGEAFQCQTGTPMRPESVCEVW